MNIVAFYSVSAGKLTIAQHFPEPSMQQGMFNLQAR
jgi:hypothetical protein